MIGAVATPGPRSRGHVSQPGARSEPTSSPMAAAAQAPRAKAVRESWPSATSAPAMPTRSTPSELSWPAVATKLRCPLAYPRWIDWAPVSSRNTGSSSAAARVSAKSSEARSGAAASRTAASSIQATTARPVSRAVTGRASRECALSPVTSRVRYASKTPKTFASSVATVHQTAKAAYSAEGSALAAMAIIPMVPSPATPRPIVITRAPPASWRPARRRPCASAVTCGEPTQRRVARPDRRKRSTSR